MDAEDLKLRCIEASKFYYKYLEENNKGVERINISSKILINAESNIYTPTHCQDRKLNDLR
jgi:hypothetical protein